MTKDFYFKGSLSSSKSIYNRALIIQSFAPEIKVVGYSEAEDVIALKAALSAFARGENRLECKEAGTVMRFLMARVSRHPGFYILTGNGRLLQRPHDGLIDAMRSLEVQVTRHEGHLEVQSRGWTASDVPLRVDSKTSSQFLSGLLLSAWGLPFDLRLDLSETMVSRDYFLMTRRVCEDFGMQLIDGASGEVKELLVPKNQRPKLDHYVVEPDMSSCFAIASIAALSGLAVFDQFPIVSVQPDYEFINILRSMGVPVEWRGEDCIFSRTDSLKPIDLDLSSTPDMFPVLAVLAAMAQGPSKFKGLSHLKYKESDRLKNTVDLLQRCGRTVDVQGDEVHIHGKAEALSGRGEFFPDGDHRMAMAAQVANFAGAEFVIRDRHVVDKSFPEFWLLTEGYL
ncbi:MAG: 3-phosphoshikimate 1-carboxyvinyltransferase [Bdellovibrionales bacterium]|nr:3-phosphoshikimate 1-carboxyvinyltransferase [Bdellovibrionales bacterium]